MKSRPTMRETKAIKGPKTSILRTEIAVRFVQLAVKIAGALATYLGQNRFAKLSREHFTKGRERGRER